MYFLQALLLFLLFIFLNGCYCSSNVGLDHASRIFVDRRGASKFREKIFEIITRLTKIDTKYTIDLGKLRMNQSNTIDISIKNGKVICNKGPNMTSVRIIKSNFIRKYISKAYYLLDVEYEDLSSDSQVINPLPLMVDIQDNSGQSLHDIYSVNSKVYLVCEQVGAQALLVSKEYEKLFFIEAPWSVRIKFEVEKNPFAQFGIRYRARVIDNINIFTNKKKDFLWPIRENVLSYHYFFLKVLKDQEKGKFCTLSSEKNSFKVILFCDFMKNKKSTFIKTNAYISITAFLTFLLYYWAHNTNEIKIVTEKNPFEKEKLDKFIYDDTSEIKGLYGIRSTFNLHKILHRAKLYVLLGIFTNFCLEVLGDQSEISYSHVFEKLSHIYNAFRYFKNAEFPNRVNLAVPDDI